MREGVWYSQLQRQTEWGFVICGAPRRGCCCSAIKHRLAGCVWLGSAVSELSGLVLVMSPPYSGSSAALWEVQADRTVPIFLLELLVYPPQGSCNALDKLSLLLPCFTPLPWLRM